MRNTPIVMATFPDGTSVTKAHQVCLAGELESLSSWVPAHMHPEATLSKREKFLTYGFVLIDNSSCLIGQGVNITPLRCVDPGIIHVHSRAAQLPHMFKHDPYFVVGTHMSQAVTNEEL